MTTEPTAEQITAAAKVLFGEHTGGHWNDLIKSALLAAFQVRPPVNRDELRLVKRPIAFCVETPNGVSLFHDEDVARRCADQLGIEYQGLYIRDGSPLPPVDRDAVIEECAKVVEAKYDPSRLLEVAAAIRALKSQPADPSA
jgi:hypothetical protein